MKRIIKSIEPTLPDTAMKVWCLEREIDGLRYGEEICARTWEEAEEIAAKFGATVIGERITVTCMVCGEIVINNLSTSEGTVESVN